MAWIYLAALEESARPFRPGLDQSPIVKAIDTLKLCCFRAWLGASCFQLQSQYGTTCEHFEESISTFPMSTSSTAASHVRTSVLRAMVQARRESEEVKLFRELVNAAKISKPYGAYLKALNNAEAFIGKIGGEK